MVHLSFCQNSPRAQHKWPAHTHTGYHTPPLEIHICLILKVSEFGPLLLPIFQRKSDSQQAWRQKPLFHRPCVSPFVICKWKKSHSTCSTFHARRREVCLQKSTASRADESLLFVPHVPLPLISSYFTHGLWIGLYLSARRALIGWKEEIMIPIPPVLFSPPFC